MNKSFRQDRLNETIKEFLSELLLSGVKDPRIGLVTITAVKVSQDLMTAKVYYSVMGTEEERQASQDGLKSAGNFLRKTLGRELKLRYSPELHFVYDDSLDRAIAIEEALREAKKKTEDD